MQKLWETLEASGFSGRYSLDGSYHRFDRRGENNAWFRGVVTASGAAYASWGDWKTGEKHSWTSLDDSPALDPAELARLQIEIAQAQEQHERERKAAQEETAKQANAIWEQATPADPGHGYLVTKQIPPGPARQVGDTLLIPMRDTLGRLWNLQRITPDGDKYFLPGGRISGLYCALGSPTDTLWLCEGFATGQSFHTATGQAVAVAFNTGNLPHAASELKHKYPSQAFGIAADNDHKTPGNPGLKAAAKAAEILGPGTYVAIPGFPPDSQGTDFNDLATAHGPGAVTEAVAKLRNASETRVSQARGLQPLPPVTKNGKLVMQPEQAYANALLDARPAMVSQGEDLFEYTGTHWQILSEDGHKDIKRDLQRLYGGGATNAKIESTYKLFCLAVPSVPQGVDMFTPHPMAANFQNGTLWLERRAPGAGDQGFSYGTVFRPHKREDFLITCLPYDYQTSYTPNAEFDAMLERIFDGDPEKAVKIHMLSEMFGACLIPAFPHIWMLQGVPGTGKSTVLKLAAKLVTDSNRSNVDPSQFKGFDMDSMAGKLVNMVLDIDTTHTMSESQIKMIVDRVPFRIKRKFKRDLYAPIPAVHLFGGNALPKLPEGRAGAFDRRWTVMVFRKEFAANHQHFKEYEQHVFDAGPGGILAFALAGLERICAQKGHFTRSEESKVEVKNWQSATDHISLFLGDCQDGVALGGLCVTFTPGGKIPRADLWRVFDLWQAENLRGVRGFRHTGKFGFFEALRARGFKESRGGSDGGYVVHGFQGKPTGAV